MIIYVFVRIPHCTYPHYIPLNGDIYRWECSGLVGTQKKLEAKMIPEEK